MKLTYLLNSGFMIRAGRTLLLFDDYDDPSGAADRAVDMGDFEWLYIFVSHAPGVCASDHAIHFQL